MPRVSEDKLSRIKGYVDDMSIQDINQSIAFMKKIKKSKKPILCSGGQLHYGLTKYGKNRAIISLTTDLKEKLNYRYLRVKKYNNKEKVLDLINGKYKTIIDALEANYKIQKLLDKDGFEIPTGRLTSMNGGLGGLYEINN